MNRKIKKYLLPNFPYLMAFWFFSKLGTAYRMVRGGNAGEKLFGMMEAIGSVFQNYAPGLGLLNAYYGTVMFKICNLLPISAQKFHTGNTSCKTCHLPHQIKNLYRHIKVHSLQIAAHYL